MWVDGGGVAVCGVGWGQSRVPALMTRWYICIFW